MTYEQLKQANAGIQTTDIKGKEYAEVPQRIKAFRSVCPDGAIITDIVSLADGVCVIKATILDAEKNVLGTGHAYEKEGSTFINKTSYIENCETSAVGRALGMCGFGIETSVASFEEVMNAKLQQTKKEPSKQPSDDEFNSFVNQEEPKITRVQREMIIKACTDEEISKLCKSRGVVAIANLTAKQAEGILNGLQKQGRSV